MKKVLIIVLFIVMCPLTLIAGEDDKCYAYFVCECETSERDEYVAVVGYSTNKHEDLCDYPTVFPVTDTILSNMKVRKFLHKHCPSIRGAKVESWFDYSLGDVKRSYRDLADRQASDDYCIEILDIGGIHIDVD